jgi:hypothetical protein
MYSYISIYTKKKIVYTQKSYTCIHPQVIYVYTPFLFLKNNCPGSWGHSLKLRVLVIYVYTQKSTHTQFLFYKKKCLGSWGRCRRAWVLVIYVKLYIYIHKKKTVYTQKSYTCIHPQVIYVYTPFFVKKKCLGSWGRCRRA